VIDVIGEDINGLGLVKVDANGDHKKGRGRPRGR